MLTNSRLPSHLHPQTYQKVKKKLVSPRDWRLHSEAAHSECVQHLTRRERKGEEEGVYDGKNKNFPRDSKILLQIKQVNLSLSKEQFQERGK